MKLVFVFLTISCGMVVLRPSITTWCATTSQCPIKVVILPVLLPRAEGVLVKIAVP